MHVERWVNNQGELQVVCINQSFLRIFNHFNCVFQTMTCGQTHAKQLFRRSK